MNLILMRHGEATDNVNELISDKEIYWSVLTDRGINSVNETISALPDEIDIMFVSPFPRTIQTAHYVFAKYPSIDVVIDDRIREIFYGKYSHQKNNFELDETRRRQISGDYFIRFGEFGENKYDIEKRITDFLLDIYKKSDKNKTVLIVSHGSIISYIKRILKIETNHLQTGAMEVFKDINSEGAIDNEIKLREMIANR